MLLTVSSSSLLTAVQSVAQCCAAHTTIPALQNIKLTAEPDSLTLTAYDSTHGIGARYTLPLIVTEPGVCILPREQALAILRESSSDLTLSSDDTAVTLTTDGDRYELPALPPAEFPDVTQADSPTPTTLSSGALRALIARTIFAADKKDTTAKFALQGVLLEPSSTSIRMMATDTKRLAIASAPSVGTSSPAVIVPLRAIVLLDKNLANLDDAEPVLIHFTAHAITFVAGNFALHSSYLSGKFPPCDAIVKKLRDVERVTLTLPVAELLSKVKRAAITSDEESRRVDCVFSSTLLTMTARGAAKGSSNVTMPLTDGAALDIAFDPLYLTDYLRSVSDAETVTLRAKDGKMSALFECGQSLFLVMPLTG